MSSPIRIGLDRDADAAYIAVSDSPVARTRQITPEVMVDLDEFDIVTGIEILGLDAAVPFDRLASECHIHSDVIDVIKLIRPTVGAFVFQTSVASAGSMRSMTMTESHPVPA
jgi:uncharacterized protein YuzE